MPENLSIMPETKLWDIITSYPQLKDLIDEMIPSYAALRSSVLRQTVGQSLNIEQAAESAKISAPDLILKLRKAAGITDNPESSSGIHPSAPAWVQQGNLTFELDARPMLSQGIHPKEIILKEFSVLNSGQFMLLITPFVPGPLIELGREAGLETWTRQGTAGRFETYFGKK
jgi:hypothetical protein